MPNERDINAINSFKKRGKCSLQLLRDAVTVIRYGPKTKEELLTRFVDGDNVQLVPTATMKSIKRIYVELRGKRHKTNRKKRTDAGSTKAKAASGRLAVRRRHAEAMRGLMDRTQVHSKSMFGTDLKPLRSTHDRAMQGWSTRFSDIKRRYSKWKQTHQEDPLKRKVLGRYSPTVKQTNATKAKKVAAEQLRRGLRCSLRDSIQAECTVRLVAGCGAEASAVKAPFHVTTTVSDADLICLATLIDASNFQCPTTATDEIPQAIVLAMLLGKRVVTPRYLSAVSRLHAKEELDGDLQTLPPSVKFQPMCTYTGQVNILVEPEFEKKNGQTVRFLNEACCLTDSAWKLFRDDERAQWGEWKNAQTQREAEQRKKDKAQTKVTTRFRSKQSQPKAKAGPNKVGQKKSLQSAK